MSPSLGSVAAGFALVGALLWPLEWWRRAVPGKPRWRRDSRTDLLYWAFTPLVSGAVSRVAVIVTVVLLALPAGVPLVRSAIDA